MPRFRVNNLWQILWRAVTSDYMLGFVLLGLALMLLLAAWLPQTTAAGLNSDVVWQAEVQRRFGDIGWFRAIRALLQATGAFSVADSLALRLLLALLGLCFFARLVDRLEESWRTWRGRAPDERPPLYSQPPSAQPGRPWLELASAAIYIGGLIALLGGLLTNVWGWQVGPLAVAPGESVAFGHGSDLRLQLTSLAPDGRHGTGDLWRRDEQLISNGALALGQPLSGAGVGAYLIGSGTGLHVRATSGDGRPLALQTGPGTPEREELTLTFSAEAPRHLVAIDEADLVLFFQAAEPEGVGEPQPSEGDAGPQVQLFQEGSGEFILDQAVSEAAVLTVEDITLALTPVPYAHVRVVRDVGAFWSQVGAAVMGGGLFFRLFWPFRRRRRRRAVPAGPVVAGAGLQSLEQSGKGLQSLEQSGKGLQSLKRSGRDDPGRIGGG